MAIVNKIMKKINKYNYLKLTIFISIILLCCSCTNHNNKIVEKENEKLSSNTKIDEKIINNISDDKKYEFNYSNKNSFVSLKIPKEEWDAFVEFKNYDTMPNQKNKGMVCSQAWCNFMYENIKDKYDFIVYILNTDIKPEKLPMNGYFQSIQNKIKGIGTPSFGEPFYDYSNLYGEDVSNLEGIIYLTHNDIIYDGPFLHEFMHRFGNYILDSDYGMCHWGDSNIFGRLGGYNSIEKIDNKNSKITTYRRYWDGEYAPFELYLMGLIPKNEVPDISVMHDYSSKIIEETNWNRKDGKDITISGEVKTKTYKIDEIINGKLSTKNQKKNIGERIPNFKDSKKEFNILFVAIDYDDVKEEEIKLINNQIEKLCYKGKENDEVYNFFEACKGKASIKTDVYLNIK